MIPRRARTGAAAVVLVLVLLTTVGVAPDASGTVGLERVRAGVLTLGSDSFNYPWAVVSDGTYAYYGTHTRPGRIVKVDLATLTVVGAIDLFLGEDYLASVVTDGTHAYFGTITSPGRVIKVLLDGGTCASGVACGGLERVGAIELQSGEDELWTAISDGTYALFGAYVDPGVLVRIRMDGATCAVGATCGGMERVDALAFGPTSGPGYPWPAIVESGFAYVGLYMSPAQIVKIDLASRTVVGVIELPAGDEWPASVVSDGTHAYFGTDTGPGRVIKVQLDGATCAAGVTCGGMEHVASVPLDPGEDHLYAAAHIGASVYFTTYTDPGRVVQLDAATMTRVGALGLAAGESYLTPGLVNGSSLLFGTDTTPGRVVEVRIVDVSGRSTRPEATSGDGPTVACEPSPARAGEVVTCEVSGGHPDSEILWRAAHNPTIAEAGVMIGPDGSGTFSFRVPVAALGDELRVELVDWAAPVSLGAVVAAVPTAVPAGEGPAVPGWLVVVGSLAAVGAVTAARRGQAVAG